MPYISELLNNRVYDSSEAIAGRLEDVLISPKNGSFSPLEFLLVKTEDGGERLVPYEYVENFSSSRISLKNLFAKIAHERSADQSNIFLKRDVLDQQIVDVSGTRVVRVNDLRIGNFDGRLSVLAIDASFRGLLRRLGLADNFFARMFRVQLIDWRQAQLLGNRGALQLNTLAEHLSHLHPADLANIVEELDVKRGSGLLAVLDESEAAKVLEEVDPRWQNILIKYLGPQKAAKILARMSTDEIVDLAKTFTNEESRAFLSELQGGQAASVRRLVSYEDNTAGGLMTEDFVSVRPDWTVKQAMAEIRRRSEQMRSILYVYLTDEDGRFFGVLSLRRLIASSQLEPVKNIAKSIKASACLRPEDKINRVVQMMTRYNLYTAAVIDGQKRLVGIVTVDDVMRQLFPTA